MSRLDELRKNKGKYTLVLDEGAEEEAGKAYWAKHYTAPPKPESVLPSYGPSATNRAVQEVVEKMRTIMPILIYHMNSKRLT